jgi:acetyl esterase/lipase
MMRVRIESVLVRALAGLPDGLQRLMVGRPVVIDGQELHVEAQLALKLLELGGSPPLETLSVAEARAQIVVDALAFEGPKCAVGRVEELTVGVATGSLGARLYVPAGSPGDRGLLVYFHGGGFVVCDLETHDNTCRFLAQHSGAAVLSVDYRLAPENRFPAAIEDALAAFRFALDHATEFGADPARVAVGGDSAGGNLAAGVACLAAGQRGPAPAFQLLFYPWLDLSRKGASYALFGDGFYLTERELDWYKGHYVTQEADALDPRCSPLLTKELVGVAPAYVATAGFDPLRDEGEEYAARLREAGVPVALRRHPGLIHAFVNAIGIGHVGRDALLEAAGALRVGLAAARPTTTRAG